MEFQLEDALRAAGGMGELAYAPRGWLLSSERRSADGALSESTTFTYYPSGHLKTTTFPDGGTLTYSYDAAQRLTGIADRAGNTMTRSAHWTTWATARWKRSATLPARWRGKSRARTMRSTACNSKREAPQ